MEKTLTLCCANCNTNFQKLAREYRRQLKKGNARFFCTKSCASIKINSEIKRVGNPQLLIADNRADMYTPFRWYVLRAKYRDRKKKYGCDLTVEYLKELWESQKGVCPFTNWNLILPKNTNGWSDYNPNNASLDRIDCSKGYLQGNVRFVSIMANIARSTFTDAQLKHFCKSVSMYNN